MTLLLHKDGARPGALTRFLATLLDDEPVVKDPLAVGLAHFRAGAHTEALPLLLTALEAQPHHAEALMAVGRIHLAMGQPAEALASFRLALAVDSRNAELHYASGEAHQAAGSIAEAEGCFRQAIALSPKHTDAHVRLAIVLFETGRFPEAVPVFDRALHLDQRAAVARYYLAQCCLALQDSARALTQLHFLLKQHPDYAPARYLLAGIFESRGHHRQVVAELKCLIAAGAADAAVYLRLGRAHRAIAEKEEALQAFLKAVELDGRLGEAVFQAAEILEETHRYEQALEMAMRLRNDPTYRAAANKSVVRIQHILALISDSMAGRRAAAA